MFGRKKKLKELKLREQMIKQREIELQVMEETLNRNTPLSSEIQSVPNKLLDDFINLSTLTSTNLENFLKRLFYNSGYNAERTDKFDNGVDLFVTKGNNTWIIQAKGRTIKNNLMTYNEMICKGTIKKYVEKYANYPQNYNKVIIINSYFSEEAKKIAKEYNIELIDRAGLIHLIAKINPELISKAYIKLDDLEKCPKCKIAYKVLQKNRNNYTEFYACANYCGYKENYHKF